MAEYIEREAAKNAFPRAEADAFENCRYCTCLDSEQIGEILDNIPAADVVPVVHGKWVQKRKQITIDSYWIRWECSECGYCRTKGWEHSSDGKKPRAKLCEMCGALMDKGGD